MLCSYACLVGLTLRGRQNLNRAGPSRRKFPFYPGFSHRPRLAAGQRNLDCGSHGARFQLYLMSGGAVVGLFRRPCEVTSCLLAVATIEV